MIGPVFFLLLETSIRKGVRAALAFDCGVLLSDLIQRGDVITSDPSRLATAPDLNLLQKVLDGVRAI